MERRPALTPSAIVAFNGASRAARMADPKRHTVSLDAGTAVVVIAATIVIAALAVTRLRGYPYHLDVRAAMHGAATTAAATGAAAARTWTVVGIVIAALATWLR